MDKLNLRNSCPVISPVFYSAWTSSCLVNTDRLALGLDLLTRIVIRAHAQILGRVFLMSIWEIHTQVLGKDFLICIWEISCASISHRFSHLYFRDFIIILAESMIYWQTVGSIKSWQYVTTIFINQNLTDSSLTFSSSLDASGLNL